MGALQLATVLVGDTVLGTCGFVEVGTSNELAIQRTRSLALDSHASAVSFVFVRIGPTINAAYWGIYLGNGTIGLGRADSFMSKGFIVHTLKLATIEVGEAVSSASGFIFTRAFNDLAVYFANTLVVNGHSVTSGHALVTVGLSVNSADWLILTSANTVQLGLASTVVSEHLFVFTNEGTLVAIGDSVLGADGSVILGTALPLLAEVFVMARVRLATVG
jgi:hypothetical protein